MAIEIIRDHTLGEELIRERVERIAAEMESSIHISYHWEGNRIKFNRVGLSGDLEYTDTSIRITIHPSLLLPISNARIREMVNSYLDHNLNGASKNAHE